jgi:PAS domain S-box-containing protein
MKLEVVRSENSRLQSFAIGMIAVFMAILVLIGWELDLVRLKSIGIGWVSMKSNTALGFLFSGLAMMLLSGRAVMGIQRKAALILAGTVAGLGAVTLVQYFTGRDWGFDQFLFTDTIQPFWTSHPGRMAPSSALCFMLTGAALWMAAWPSGTFPLSFLWALGASVAVMGSFALLGYLAEAGLGQRWWNYTGMAVHTAAAFILVGYGLVQLGCQEESWQWALDGMTTGGFAIGIALMLMATSVAYYFTGQLQRTAEWVAHRQEILKEIQSLAMFVSDLESSQRGYIITGDENLLAPREEAERGVRGNLDEIRRLIRNNPGQRQRVNELEVLLGRRLEWERRTIRDRRTSGFEEAQLAVATGAGRQLWADVRNTIEAVRNEEYRLLESDRERAATASTTAFLLMPLGAFFSLTILMVGLFFLNAGMKERMRAEGEAREREKQLSLVANNLPGLVSHVDRNLRYMFANATHERWFGRPKEDIVGCTIQEVIGADAFRRAESHLGRALKGERVDFENQIKTLAGEELFLLTTFLPDFDAAGNVQGLFTVAMDITRRKQAESEVRQLNIDLEQRVTRRTAELVAANKELEAFSYSVSHDLRAPLRSIDGFSQAVLEDYGAVLPEEGQRYLRTIREGAQKMGELIDDLLTFSRLSRLPVNREPVDVEKMVRILLRELGAESSKKLEMHIGKLPLCPADPVLLKQVWFNLMSNALKYTRQRDIAVVEIGCLPGDNGVPVWFIRDNGAGFDMQYEDKLFGVFQRLHREEEYEGTGVGLAIVQRIVHRHGGRVWAEGAVGKGATFSFTLEGATKI